MSFIAGYVEAAVFHATEAGTPQGGVISPLLANIALDGMDKLLGRMKLTPPRVSRWCELHLLRGEIILMLPEGIPHANKRIKAGGRLQKLLGDRAQVRPAAPITLTDDSEPEPDLAITHMPEDRYDQHHPYPEDLYWVVEYSNASLEKDLGIKAEIYAAANIPEYWIINLRTGVLIVLRDPIDGQYRDRQELSQGAIASLAFPDVTILIETIL